MSLESDIPANTEKVKVVQKKIIKKVGNNHIKYIVVLKLLNVILTNIGKPNIDDITMFVDIDREDIIKEVNKESIIAMEDELFPLFNEKASGYHRKTNNLVLNLLRNIVKDIGYELTYTKKDVYKLINGINYRRSSALYYIK